MLDRTLDSLSKQNKDILKKVEILIFDGNSRDYPFKVVNKYKNKFKIIFKSSHDSLIYEAWNKALKIASGQYISFLGAGDILTPLSLEKLNKISKKTNNNNIIITSQSVLVTKEKKTFISGKKFIFNEFKSKFTTNHSLLLYSNDIFKIYGNFSLDYGVAGDYEFLLRIGKYIKTKYLKYPTCEYLIGGISSRSIKPILLNYKIRRSFNFHPIYIDLLLLGKAIIFFYVRSLVGRSYGKKII